MRVVQQHEDSRGVCELFVKHVFAQTAAAV